MTSLANVLSYLDPILILTEKHVTQRVNSRKSLKATHLTEQLSATNSKAREKTLRHALYCHDQLVT